MIIYGPCVNPRVLINGYPYEILATIEAGEHVIIDSSENTIMKDSDGKIVSLFNERGFEYSVFEPIPPGLLTFVWSSFGFDLTIFKKRREAAW